MTEEMREAERDLRNLLTSAGPDSRQPDDRARAVALRRQIFALTTETALRNRRSSDFPPPGRCLTWEDHEWSGSRVVATGRDQGGNYSVVASRCARCGHGRQEVERPESPSSALLPVDAKSWKGGQ